MKTYRWCYPWANLPDPSQEFVKYDDHEAALAEKDAEIKRLTEAMWAQHERNVELKKALDQAIEISGLCLASDGESVADGTESTAFWHRKPELAAYLKEKEQ